MNNYMLTEAHMVDEGDMTIPISRNNSVSKSILISIHTIIIFSDLGIRHYFFQWQKKNLCQVNILKQRISNPF
jgi:hypothetical protein